ncbi:MAG: glutamate synthase [Anaerolineales bacterium]
MKDRREFHRAVRRSRGRMLCSLPGTILQHDEAAEGGCGVIGMASSVPVAGRHLLQSLRQMRNRGNGKGGGAAIVGLEPGSLGLSIEQLRDCYLLTIAYLDEAVQSRVEKDCIEPGFTVEKTYTFPMDPPAGLEPAPPKVVTYASRVRPSILDSFAEEHGLTGADRVAVEEEWVYQNTYQLNNAFYASLGEQQAFVLSHGKDTLSLKMVAYGDDVIETYHLDDLKAHVWIGHHRYPTKGRVWHPGGAHPFTGMHEALVHNGDFANYASVRSYLAQHNIKPLFLTDTEVSVLVFDLLHRTFGYPLEYVIEALAPTTERDFTLLPEEKKRVYRQIQQTHIHGSPDGPWFFLITQSADAGRDPRLARLIGITDTSMLRPQVFALQQGESGMPSIGFAASEKQAIDAALASLAAEDDRFWPRADKFWAARGGSHTDGGAFMFDVVRNGDGHAELVTTDKFGRRIQLEEAARPDRGSRGGLETSPDARQDASMNTGQSFDHVQENLETLGYRGLETFLQNCVTQSDDDRQRAEALELLAKLMDRRYPTGSLRRSSILTLVDSALNRWVDSILEDPSDAFKGWQHGAPLPEPSGNEAAIVIVGSGFAPEGSDSLARAVVQAADAGYRRVIVTGARGHRFLGNGLGANTERLRLDVFGSPGDYLASGLDGAEIIVHGSGQDQMAQIMKSGKLVVHGDVGQTFLYAAKGGQVYVLGSAAGRPLINGVGSPKVVINGTCLDYLAESFMAGDPLNGGGFAILNGIAFDDEGYLQPMESPYPGGNLFSLASGGAIFLRDPYRKVGEDQLNGGGFTALRPEHWSLIEPMLVENERLFGIPLAWLLTVDGVRRRPEEVYRAIVPVREKALQPEEAWVASG